MRLDVGGDLRGKNRSLFARPARTAPSGFERMAGFQSFRAGMQGGDVRHGTTALLAMAMRQPQPNLD
jgi:hypothetical protein